MNSYIINTLDWLAEDDANRVDWRGEWYDGDSAETCGGDVSWENAQHIQALHRGGAIEIRSQAGDPIKVIYYGITDFGREALALWQSFEYVAEQLEAEYWELAGESADNELIPVQLRALFEIISTIRPRYAIRDTVNEAERLLRLVQGKLARFGRNPYNSYISTLFIATSNWLIAWKYPHQSHRFQGYPILGLKAEHAR